MSQCSLLRIYTEERAKAGSRPLYEAIVLAAREAGLSGATVLRGPMGFGRSHRLHNAFATGLAAMPAIGLVTLEKVEVLHYANETT
jgi:PII-like signaling protein